MADPALHLDFATWTLSGPALTSTVKTVGEVASIYLDASGVDPATPVYAVDVFSHGDLTENGNLYAGLTTLYPLDVNGEFNMTRGHVHRDRHAAEYYVGLAGSGLLLLVDEEGAASQEPVRPGSVHYIPGRSGHRLVNTGQEELRVFAVWPTTAGYDYDWPSDFGVRVMRDGLRAP